MHVSELKAGQSARVLGFAVGGDKAYRHKLIAMGFTKGALFRVSRLAPLGDPIEVHIRGVNLSLRKDEANMMQIEVV